MRKYGIAAGAAADLHRIPGWPPAYSSTHTLFFWFSR
jgi:hypothetical protein